MAHIEIEPVGHVVGGRAEPTDDYWGANASIIRIDSSQFEPEATKGLDEFSHLEVIFYFHLAADNGFTGARHPRNNPAWPEVGIFGQRNKNRPNSVGLSRCKLLKVDGLDLHVQDLDAIDGTPIIDIKPWYAELAPEGNLQQPAWVSELLANYY